MTDCKTIHLSDEGAGLVLIALTMAMGEERVEADRYEYAAERSGDETYRDKLLLLAADCRKRAEQYRELCDTIQEEVLRA